MNAKTELIKACPEWRIIRCAQIRYAPGYLDDDDTEVYNLPEGWTADMQASWLTSLDFDYDNGFGSQHLFGTVWFTDGTWLERREYDGSERWAHKTCPDIPADLRRS